jgi:O-phosphoseryl-tRNA(Cys) synthetase
MPRTIIQVSALGFTLVSAIMLAKGNLTLSPYVIADLQIARAGYHPELINSLSAQYADTWIGIILLCLSFLLQLFVIIRPMRWVDFQVNRVGVVVAVLITLFVLVVSLKISDVLAHNMKNKVENILLTPKPDSITDRSK